MICHRVTCHASDGRLFSNKHDAGLCSPATVEWIPDQGTISVFRGHDIPHVLLDPSTGAPIDCPPAARHSRRKALQLQLHVAEVVNVHPDGAECANSAADVAIDGRLQSLSILYHVRGNDAFAPRMLQLIHETRPDATDDSGPAGGSAALHHLYRALLALVLPEGKRHFTAIISPVSGKGDGAKKFHSIAVPILASSPHTFSTVVTTHRHHAEKYAELSPLRPGEVLVAVGGDGMVHEVINGLARRRAREGDKAVRLATFPTGSGCALATVLGIIKPIDAALALVSGRDVIMGLMGLHFTPIERLIPGRTSKEPRIRALPEAVHVSHCTAFLSVNACFGAAVDLESEKFRWMGNNRFAFYAVKKLVAGVPRYPITIRYKPAVALDSSSGASVPLRDLESVKRLVPRFDQSLGSQPVKLVDHGGDDDEWVTLEQSEFSFLLLCNIPWISRDMLAAPYSHPSDGCLDLLYIAPGVSRSELVRMMLMMEDGTHVNHPMMRYAKCRECEIRPHDGLLSIDGERYPLAQVNATLLPDTEIRLLGAAVRTPSNLAS